MIYNDGEKLEILKINLQIHTTANDQFLESLLKQAKGWMLKRGIAEEDTVVYHMTQIDYAAFLFRKRANMEATIPSHLKQELRDLLFSQKMK